MLLVPCRAKQKIQVLDRATASGRSETVIGEFQSVLVRNASSAKEAIKKAKEILTKDGCYEISIGEAQPVKFVEDLKLFKLGFCLVQV